MAERPHQLVAAAVRTKVRRCPSAACEHHGVAPEGRFARGDLPPAATRHQAGDFGFAAGFHPAVRQFVAKHIEDGGCLARAREDLSGLLPSRLDAEAPEECECRLQVESSQRRAGEFGVRPVKAVRGEMCVGEIAASIAGRQQLLADAGHALENGDRRAAPRRADRRDHAGRAPADDDDSGGPAHRCFAR